MRKAGFMCNWHRQLVAVALALVWAAAATAAPGPRKLPLPAEEPAPPSEPGIGQPGVDIRSAHEQQVTGPVVNASVKLGNQAETTTAVNPTNPNNVVTFSNEGSGGFIFRAASFDGGLTWTRSDAISSACCDGQAVFDTFGNLFLVYITSSGSSVNVVTSIDGGLTFSTPVVVGSGGIDQPSIAVGNGSVWVDWNLNGQMVAKGAPVSGLGVWGPFGSQQSIPQAFGSFGGITVGPGPNGGKVIVTYQNPYGDQGPSTIYCNVDADGLGPGGFGSKHTVTQTNVGGFDYIPAQSSRSIDAEAGVVWDATLGPYSDRIYLVYTDETVNENNDTDIEVRTSTDDGATWSAAVRVNDDPPSPIRSQFLPYIAIDRFSGLVAVGWHDCRNDNGVPGSGGTDNVANNDAEYYASYTTDGGATWAANERLSGGFSNAGRAHSNVDYGDYVGTDMYAGVFHAGWADNSNSTGDNPDGTLNRFDIYTNAWPIGDISAGVSNPGAGDSRLSPVRLVLAAPEPNPASGPMLLSYNLPAEGRVRLTLHDVSGREVIRLVDAQTQPAGWHSLNWNGRSSTGDPLSAGVYFLRLADGMQTRVQRTIILK